MADCDYKCKKQYDKCLDKSAWLSAITFPLGLFLAPFLFVYCTARYIKASRNCSRQQRKRLETLTMTKTYTKQHSQQ